MPDINTVGLDHGVSSKRNATERQTMTNGNVQAGLWMKRGDCSITNNNRRETLLSLLEQGRVTTGASCKLRQNSGYSPEYRVR